MANRVAFWDWNEAGKEVRFSGEVEDEFTDPDERFSRPSYRVKLDAHCAEHEGQRRTPYVDECLPIRDDDDGRL